MLLALFAAYCAFMAFSWRRRRLLWWPIERRLMGINDRRERDEDTVRDRRHARERRSNV